MFIADYTFAAPGLACDNTAMRIIAGELKGREITLPKGSRARPVTSFILEMAMSLFTPDRLVAGPFIDLCAGSGSASFEALSRGAPRAILVEADQRTAGHLHETAVRFGVAERTVILRSDARRCWTKVAHLLDGAPAQAAFADPPFIKGMALDLLRPIGQAAALFGPAALIIVRSIDQLPPVAGLELIESRRAGQSQLWLYRPAGA